eukprot:TRINITY_DN1580_c2_g5_i1.p1 TRINITY_DN1580_c2_g5~~TRINITY_DN1580_c2_g5_i1.p1  ORF type:complete len:338 (+),score=75.86 TRINITY_DN1580_c2_g5_i1:91-1104(+)
MGSTAQRIALGPVGKWRMRDFYVRHDSASKVRVRQMRKDGSSITLVPYIQFAHPLFFKEIENLASDHESTLQVCYAPGPVVAPPPEMPVTVPHSVRDCEMPVPWRVGGNTRLFGGDVQGAAPFNDFGIAFWGLFKQNERANLMAAALKERSGSVCAPISVYHMPFVVHQLEEDGWTLDDSGSQEMTLIDGKAAGASHVLLGVSRSTRVVFFNLLLTDFFPGFVALGWILFVILIPMPQVQQAQYAQQGYYGAPPPGWSGGQSAPPPGWGMPSQPPPPYGYPGYPPPQYPGYQGYPPPPPGGWQQQQQWQPPPGAPPMPPPHQPPAGAPAGSGERGGQ